MRTMKRFLVLLFLGALGALGIWYGMRGNSTKASSSTVTALLPKETLAFLHVPDFNRSYGHWQQTSIHKLWREPAMQEFLQKPLTRLPATGEVRAKLRDFQALEMTDGFLAITAWANNQPKMLGGFRFKGTAVEAEKVVGNWRRRLQENAPDLRRETVQHSGDQIEVVTRGAITIATVYSGDWFLAANDVPALQLLLDRANGRNKDAATTLAKDETYLAAFKHMPAVYAAFGYARLEDYFQRLAASHLPGTVQGNDQLAMMRQVKTIAGATRFEDGKIRDVLFVGMPKASNVGELTRSSLPLGTAESFFYSASLFAFSQPPALPDPQAAAAAGLPGVLQRFVAAFAAEGITTADWGVAFGSELGLVGDWPEQSRLPGVFATLPVKDLAKAKQIAAAITSASSEAEWTTTEKDGVQYITLPPSNPLVPVAPTVGLSDRLAVLGLDRASVEAAITRGAGRESALGSSQKFQVAQRLVRDPQQSFTYFDTALLYQRLDTALRPMLVMAGAFMPTVAESVDLGKLPPAEVITKHLTPIVVSQTYEGDGYVTDSMGPVSIYQAVLGIAGISGAGAALYQKQFNSEPDDIAVSVTTIDASPTPFDLGSPSPTPAPTP